MLGNELMQNSRFRYMTNGSRVSTVVPQRDAISCKSPVSTLQVVTQILSRNPSPQFVRLLRIPTLNSSVGLAQ